MQTYTFRFQHPKSIRYIWLAFLAPVVAMMLAVWLVGLSVPVILVATLGPMAGGFYLLLKKGKASDEIVLDDKGFTSAFFGRVEYGEITRVSGQSLFMEAPSMRIVLASGRRLTWRLTIKGSAYNSVVDAETFIRFTAGLSARMDAYAAKNRRPVSATTQTGEPAPLPPLEHQPTPAEQLRKIRKRNRKPVWIIPVSTLFAALAVFKTCGKDWFAPKGPDFAKMATQQEEQYQQNVQQAKAVMREYLQQKGPHFLYTNDTAATAELVPKIDDGNPTGIRAFERIEANEQLRAFIANPDSFDIQTVILAGDASIAPMRKSILNMHDSAGTVLYIRCYDPLQRIVPAGLRGQKVTDSTELPVFDVSTGIPVYDTMQVKKPLSEAFPGMRMMLAQVRHRPSFRVYLTGRQMDGVTEALFRRTVRELNRQLAEVEVDTSAFVLKSFHP